MCNLNIVVRKDTKNYENLTSFLMGVTSNSYADNNDGDGLFCRGKFVKGFNKIDLYKYDKEIKKSRFIITHQRKATSGFSEKWTQPFLKDDFVFVHNGIINDFLGKNGSDSWGFFKKFIKEFDKLNGSRDGKIIKAIKNLLDKQKGNFYSIGIFDKKTNHLFYFKDNYANIHFYCRKNILYITTNETNKLFLKILNPKKWKEYEIKDYSIYRIKIKTDIEVLKVGKIKPKSKETIEVFDVSNFQDKKDKKNKKNKKNNFYLPESQYEINSFLANPNYIK